MNCSTPGLPVHHHLLEFTQTHVHLVSDAIQPSHPLSSPSPPAFNLSQYQGLFKWVSSSHGQSIGVSALASFLPMNIQDSFPLGWTGLTSLQFKGLTRVFSSTTIQKHQFLGIQKYGCRYNLYMMLISSFFLFVLFMSLTIVCLLRYQKWRNCGWEESTLKIYLDVS